MALEKFILAPSLTRFKLFFGQHCKNIFFKKKDSCLIDDMKAYQKCISNFLLKQYGII